MLEKQLQYLELQTQHLQEEAMERFLHADLVKETDMSHGFHWESLDHIVFLVCYVPLVSHQ